jgi:hypothetical protein
MFPIYLPGLDHRLGAWPFHAEQLRLPDEPVDVQPEPEVALRVRLTWDDGGVCALEPLAFAAGDDTSLRRPAERLHEKKNWGPAAKGLSTTWIPIDTFDGGGALGRYRLACWHVRDGACRAYGEDSAVRDYRLIWGDLLGWMVDRLRNQTEVGPLDHLGTWLDRAGRPDEAVILIGATRYTDFGEGTFVEPGDEVVVVVYDGERYTSQAVAAAIEAGAGSLAHASVLRRIVVR